MKERIENILRQFPTITLEEMGQVRLMNRIDTKYVTTLPMLERLLELAAADYRVQQIGGRVDMPYRTCYFDTPDRDMFVQHQRGRKARQKIRMRVYEDSGTAFLEIKDKDNRGRTDKKRMPVGSDIDLLSYAGFIRTHSRYSPESLLPQMQNYFYRITLVNNCLTERLTIDTGLCFRNIATGREYAPRGIVIIELKRDGRTPSTAPRLLRLLRIHPCGFSKYCMGMALTDRSLRQNRLRERVRMVEKLCLNNPII